MIDTDRSRLTGFVLRTCLGLSGAGFVSGCTAPIPSSGPHAADAVLDAQYRASGSHGAMTGDEAGQITEKYQQQIGAVQLDAAPQTEAAPGGIANDAGPGR